jgi:hypothetical protein
MGAVDMTLRLDNASGVDHMPTAATADEALLRIGSGLTRPAASARKTTLERLLPRARSNRNGGRDQIGIPGDLKSECLGEIIGIRNLIDAAANVLIWTAPPAGY